MLSYFFRYRLEQIEEIYRLHPEYNFKQVAFALRIKPAAFYQWIHRSGLDRRKIMRSTEDRRKNSPKCQLLTNAMKETIR